MARAGVRRSFAGVGAAVVLALAAAGCGVDPGTTSSSADAPARVEAGSFSSSGGAAFLGRAAASTGKVKTMRMEMTVATKGGPVDISTRASGEFDNEHLRGRMTMDMGDVFGAMGGGEDHGTGSGAATIEEIIDGTTIYLRAPMLSAISGSSKPWAKIDIKAELPSGLGTAQSNPASMLAMLEGAGGKLTTVGTEELRGVETTHVKTTIEFDKLLDRVPASRRKAIEAQLKALGSSSKGLPEAPVEAWVDADGYVRKFTMTMAPSLGGSSTKDLSVTATIELYDFNEPVDITIPPASQVATLDLEDLGGN